MPRRPLLFTHEQRSLGDAIRVVTLDQGFGAKVLRSRRLQPDAEKRTSSDFGLDPRESLPSPTTHGAVSRSSMTTLLRST